MVSAVRDFSDFRAFPGLIEGKKYCFPTLFSMDSRGRTRYWRQYVVLMDGDDVLEFDHDWEVPVGQLATISDRYYDAPDIPYYALIYNEQGIENGKMSRHPPTVVKEGAVGLRGKANSRNAFTQALIKARGIYQKKIDQGYRTTLADLSDKGRRWMAMAAHNYADNIDRIEYPCFSQPKIDGVRCLMTLSDGRIIKYTRRGNEYPGYDEWDDELMPIFKESPNLHLDGELYLHGKNLQEITGVARNEVKAFGLSYYVFDLFDTDCLSDTYETRMEKLSEIFSRIHSPSIVQVPSVLVNNKKTLDKLYRSYIDNGYEGQMIRNCDGLYETSQDRELRSRSLLKRKAVFSDEFEFVEAIRAENGRAAGTFVGKFKTVNGVLFNASPKNMTIADMKNLYVEVSGDPSYVGKYATIEYEDLSNDGVPLRPKFVAFRFD